MDIIATSKRRSHLLRHNPAPPGPPWIRPAGSRLRTCSAHWSSRGL